MCEHETMQQLSLIAWLACTVRAEAVFVSNDLIGQRALSNGHLTHSFDLAHLCSKCGNLAGLLHVCSLSKCNGLDQ